MIEELQFEITEEQVLVRDMVRRFLQADYAATARDGVVWKKLGEMSWLGCAVPESAGGFAGGTMTLALIVQEFGRALIPDPVVPVASQSVTSLAAIGTPQTQILLEKIAIGDLKLMTAHTEFGRGDREIDAVATRDGEGWVISGKKAAVLGGDQADAFLVSAQNERERQPSIFLVPRDAHGLDIDAFQTFDDRGAAHLTLSEIVLPAAARLATGATAAKAIAHGLDHALILSSAEILGALELAFELTCSYLNTRRQFGRPIREFQVLQHRLVDMYIEMEQARSMVMLGVSALDSGSAEDRALAAAAVKARVAKAARFVAAQAVQLHGGIGMTEEHAVGPIFKRAVGFDLWLGTGNEHSSRYAALDKLSASVPTFQEKP
jgi:alkylation response protein AidB-like acyl-CoA dehydrogenase